MHSAFLTGNNTEIKIEYTSRFCSGPNLCSLSGDELQANTKTLIEH